MMGNNIETPKVLSVLEDTIRISNEFLPKFEKGTAQHSLLINRIKALEISKALILGDVGYTKQEIEKALKPIESIISKTSKVVLKLKENTGQYNRSISIIQAMNVAREYIIKELEK